ncbi:elongation of very long chain fatty acids protein 6-like [Mercenaria mercenaria]|uniref:elongation of very long chain fatty acids protein 6-like n=1 Tax=Mercenaria mercenaria TaxID=6596 RepID=UPI00234E96DB|nr:elongation of very long chain fatty acids protein 6-like [Mercenaria mercenaria]XP_053374724.1 elongation of very long chain fatty acids protein 6-like [Mercenaria mercenaria]
MDISNKDPANMTYIFQFERTHDVRAFDNYMYKHWSDCFVYSAIYLVVIFSGRYVMESRERFDLRPYLAVWSGLLAVFSILGALRTVPELIWALSYHGFEYTCCSGSYLDQGKVSAFWTMLFALSKVVELGDTVFIILRKQQLIFLHWYHHITVLMYVWYSFTDKIGSARYYQVMNYTVHSLMYTYYTLRAMKFRLPRWISILITCCQLAQMAVGIFVILVSYSVLSAGKECVTSYTNIRYSLTMYFSYLVLFMHFFYKNYIVKRPDIHEKKL